MLFFFSFLFFLSLCFSPSFYYQLLSLSHFSSFYLLLPHSSFSSQSSYFSSSLFLILILFFSFRLLTPFSLFLSSSFYFPFPLSSFLPLLFLLHLFSHCTLCFLLVCVIFSSPSCLFLFSLLVPSFLSNIFHDLYFLFYSYLFSPDSSLPFFYSSLFCPDLFLSLFLFFRL